MASGPLSDSEGSVLDPIVAIRQSITLEPDETARIDLVTGVAETRDDVLALIEKYHDRSLADRVFELAWTHSQVDAAPAQRHRGRRPALRAARELRSSTPTPRLRAEPERLDAATAAGQSGLWGYGISGDLPIVLLRIADQANIELVRQLVQAHAYWRIKGLAVDLVIWNEDHVGLPPGPRRTRSWA